MVLSIFVQQEPFFGCDSVNIHATDVFFFFPFLLLWLYYEYSCDRELCFGDSINIHVTGFVFCFKIEFFTDLPCLLAEMG